MTNAAIHFKCDLFMESDCTFIVSLSALVNGTSARKALKLRKLTWRHWTNKHKLSNEDSYMKSAALSRDSSRALKASLTMLIILIQNFPSTWRKLLRFAFLPLAKFLNALRINQKLRAELKEKNPRLLKVKLPPSNKYCFITGKGRSNVFITSSASCKVTVIHFIRFLGLLFQHFFHHQLLTKAINSYWIRSRNIFSYKARFSCSGINMSCFFLF